MQPRILFLLFHSSIYYLAILITEPVGSIDILDEELIMIKQDFVATKPLMVARSKVESLFPGLNGKTLANQLSEGRGPKAYRVGRKIFYRVEELEAYLTERPIQTVQSPS